jgi:hypothetical protein
VRFIRHASREFIDELAFRENHGAETRTFTALANHADHAAIKVMCIPVRDETDELAALMAAQVFDSPSVRASALPAGRVDEILNAVAQEKPDVVFLSALPPFGLARSHRIYSTLRARDGKLRIMIGIWNYPDDPGEAAKKISGAEEGRVWTRLSDAAAEVRLIAGVRPDADTVQGESAA